MYLKSAAAACAALISVAATAVPASAQHWNHGGYHGGYRSGIGPGIAGFAAGALIGGALASQPYYGPGYSYGYAPGYAYDYAPSYGYAPGYSSGPVYGAADDGDSDAYCQSRYRSYDPGSGTYLGYDGARHPCP